MNFNELGCSPARERRDPCAPAQGYAEMPGVVSTSIPRIAIGTIAATSGEFWRTLRAWLACRSTLRGKLATCLLPLACSFLPLASHAVTATGLSSFDGIEEPLVRYASETGEFIHDDLVNITHLGDGVFRMLLRYRSAEWDGDRDTPNKDRQRAEVKGLGVHQKTGESFDYATTWRTNPDFRGASCFCHIFQLKSTDGDSGMPVVTISILEGQQRAAVRYCSGHSKKEIVAREFAWTPGKWQTVRVRIRTSMTDDGEVLASIDGDPFEGARDLAVYRPGATDYRPKWGLYRGTKPGLSLGNDYVEHKNVSANETRAPSDPEQIAMENEARKLVKDSPTAALTWLQSQAPSPARVNALATVAAEWAQAEPQAAMSFVEKLPPTELGRDAAMLRSLIAGAIRMWMRCCVGLQLALLRRNWTRCSGILRRIQRSVM